ncbi:MAG: tRNA (adenosine(37)-N6)-threonylcarbamoyltransferase complex transferase subunit TsaD [Defluviitaleaceae bacterium]|nr:tRNA (adenosine(37)-N6)-threonylcarbamoyltransferase complex transferase subunit TsaD [Defluviitaleaceae bacterium]
MKNNKDRDAKILAIETSCDETAAAVVIGGRVIISNIIYSQIEIHREFGGVVPEIASRNHIAKIDEVVSAALAAANLDITEIDAVAATAGPGLIGALLVGLSFGKALAYAAGLPIIGVNHIEGHICSNYLENPDFAPPFVCLVVSGGHTHLIYVKDYGEYEVLGKTRDDAAGEAFDKVARSLGLNYPGGVEIDKLAKHGNQTAVNFPRAWLEATSLDFSFSGLKSAVLNYLNSAKMSEQEIVPADVAASFQKALVDVLVEKSISACKLKNAAKLAVAGGVGANSFLRKALTEKCEENKIILNIPSPIFCTDNAAMIASCGYFSYIRGKFDNLNLNAYPNLAGF